VDPKENESSMLSRGTEQQSQQHPSVSAVDSDDDDDDGDDDDDESTQEFDSPVAGPVGFDLNDTRFSFALDQTGDTMAATTNS
jgi:hypothetical protein